MPQPSSRSTRTAEIIAKIEGEIKQNQHQIEQLHHRNTELRSQLKTLTPDSPVRPRSKSNYHRSSSPHRKSRHRRQTKTRSSSVSSWARVTVIALLIILVCGFLGFMIASMMTRR